MLSTLRVSRAFSLCAILFVSLASFGQNTIQVPADRPTIQGAIDAANNGDTVLVAPGTYYENINFNGKAVTVTSSGGAAQTIIDGGQSGSVLTFSNGEGRSSSLNGFTMQNGRAEFNSQLEGGGIYITLASPSITNNLIQNNAAAAYGGGIWVNSGSPLIQNNVIRNNSQVPGYSGGAGGGIVLIGTSSPQIISNKITNNSWPTGWAGGISVTGAGTPTIKNNLIANNSVGADGGGIDIDGESNALVEQNLIYGNFARFGSGIYVSVPFGSTGPILLNNTVVTGSSFYPQGSSIYFSGFDNQVQVANNILVGGSGQNSVYCDGAYQGQPPIFANNDAFGSSGTGFGGTCAGFTGQNGNVSADPLFVNPAGGDFHVQLNSPAVDAGTNAFPILPQIDFAGNPRILDGNNDCVSTVDLGAYELVRTANVSFSTNALTFGTQVPGNSSNPQSVTLRNSGTSCFQFSNIGITGDFSQANTCSAAGARGGTSCTFNITFTPTALGGRNGALTVSGSDGFAAASPSVSLSGVGADFSVAGSPASVSVKHGQSVKYTITVNPVGGTFSSSVALSCSGLPSKAACSFSPSSVTPGENSVTSGMTVSTSGNTPRGNYNILVVGKSGTDVHSTTVLLAVN